MPAQSADLIPLEKYAEVPPASVIRMSPDGTKFAIAASQSGKHVLLIRSLKDPGSVINLGKLQVRWATWKSPSRLVLGLFTSTDNLFFGDYDRFGATRMMAINADGSGLQDIGEPNGGFINRDTSHPDLAGGIHPQVQDELAGVLENDPHHVMQTVVSIVPRLHENLVAGAWRVDVDTGHHEELVHARPTFQHYKVDSSGTVRIAEGLDGTNEVVYVRDDDSSEWRLIHRRSFNQPGFEPIAFDPGSPTMLYVLTTGTNGVAGLWDFDTRTMTLDHLVDGTASNVMTVRNGTLIGYQQQNGSWKYLDSGWQHDLETMQHAMPNQSIDLIDRTTDGQHVLVRAETAHAPPSWWLLDRTLKPTNLSPIVKTYPDIAAAGIAPVKLVTYRARDGLPIEAWLTLPKDSKGDPIPFVVLPHGGPAACDTGSFDYLVQFLASRGYGVLQPQFRGSTCEGEAFERMGFGQWGLAMQDDVTDGTRWLIGQKLADPKRIAIVGASYGGYAALEGVVKEPDLYRCAAAWAPVTDLSSLAKSFNSGDGGGELMLERIGRDGGQLDAASPAQHADRIKVPVLLIHGKTDFTVQVRQSERMEEALKAAHKQVEAIYLDDADHYLMTEPARRTWLEALNRFLGTNLGPGSVAR